MGKNFYFHFYLFFIHFFSIEFFEGVSRGGPHRWSMDRSVRGSVDPVRWTGSTDWGSVFSGHPIFCIIEKQKKKDAADRSKI